MERMWMVRAEAGTLYDLFRERSAVTIGWTELAAKAKPGMTRQQLVEFYRSALDWRDMQEFVASSDSSGCMSKLELAA